MTTMNEKALTSGEWRANTSTTGNVLRVRRGRKIIAEVPYHRDYSTWADAQLIAAAPDMLRALQALLDDVGPANSMPGAGLAREAIRKAIGAA